MVDSSINLGLFMAGMCCGVVGEGETSATIEPSSRALKRRKMELLTYKFIADVAAVPATAAVEFSRKRRKLELCASGCSSSRGCDNGVESSGARNKDESEGSQANEASRLNLPLNLCENSASEHVENESSHLVNPKFGVTSVCGRRRDMEDAVSIHPCFSQQEGSVQSGFHFFGVFDGHGCSHVRIQDRRFSFLNLFKPISLVQNSNLRFQFLISLGGDEVQRSVARNCEGRARIR